MKIRSKQSGNGGFTMTRHGKNLSDLDRPFDVEYWQSQGDQAIFDAAW